eukprot:scaffold124360_cov22-Tisochrysis_lutea.AAC.1
MSVAGWAANALAGGWKGRGVPAAPEEVLWARKEEAFVDAGFASPNAPNKEAFVEAGAGAPNAWDEKAFVDAGSGSPDARDEEAFIDADSGVPNAWDEEVFTDADVCGAGLAGAADARRMPVTFLFSRMLLTLSPPGHRKRCAGTNKKTPKT